MIEDKDKVLLGQTKRRCQTVVYTLRLVCSKGRSNKNMKAPLAAYTVGSPMERVAVDVLGPSPVSDKRNKYLLIARDYFTK